MALSDPQTVNIDGDAFTLPRVGIGPSSAVYKTADQGITLTVSHQRAKRSRTTVRVDTQFTMADPMVPAVNVQRSGSIYLVVDAPLNGWDLAAQVKGVQALAEYLTRDSAANTTKVLGGES